MRRFHIAVTFDIGEKEKELLLKAFSGEVTLTFLTEMNERDRKEALSTAEVLLAWNLPRELKKEEYQLLRRLRFIQLLSAGADHLPFDDIPPGVKIASNVGAYAEPMAEHVLAMTLALSKHLLENHKKLAQGEFNQFEANKMLSGSTVGIIGFGGIGRASAKLFRCLGCRIYAINTSGKTEEEVDFIGTLKDLDHVLRESDVVVLSIALNKQTYNLIGKRELERMKRECILVNVARGALIDEEALYEHLKNNPDFMAGIDAWWVEPFGKGRFQMDHPFCDLPNFLGSPHNSSMVPGVIPKATALAAQNILKFLHGEEIRGVVSREQYL
ncbi:2-hydroxyacid dehydrogenase [Acetomicrobium sp. S15 = DSM 107314]|jgi:glycerate dehydrogenase|uniref:2-hydroxyacid dehydrogenase n=1 Tax=Acetomicrobium sp. S15 = DSM 107314 TaxID=2529858 RepID=UPI0018E18487|nr:2-hydroxyacid dehydrogenase [Acetomicrobium sp. S15 = DSM 107314]